jgi:hypothetical protein
MSASPGPHGVRVSMRNNVRVLVHAPQRKCLLIDLAAIKKCGAVAAAFLSDYTVLLFDHVV